MSSQYENPRQLATSRGRLPFPATLIHQLLVLGSAAMPLTASAYQPTTLLGSTGLTELQQRTGDAVQTVCEQLDAMSGKTAEQVDLNLRCASMVGNASTIENAGHPAQGFSLGWATNEQLSAIVQTVSTEELAATKSMANEFTGTQSNAVFSRLHSLRSGARFGAVANGVNIIDRVAKGSDAPMFDDTRQYGGAAGDSLGGQWGMFANVNYSTGDREATDNEDAFDYDSTQITVGADMRVTDKTVVGGLVSYQNISSDFDDNNSFTTSPSGTPGGNVDADAYGISFYATHYVDAFYVDGTLGYTRTSYDIDRNIIIPVAPGAVTPVSTIDRKASADTDGDTFSVSVGGGMDMSAGSVSFGPYARLNYEKTYVDGYKESGALGLNLTVDEQKWESFTSALGAQISMASSQEWGVLTPYARAGWIHEFANDSEAMKAYYTVDPNQNNLIAYTDDPDRNYFELNLGLSAVMPNGVQAFFDYQTILGHRYIDDHSFTVGVRMEM